jgi:hypothetical protein
MIETPPAAPSRPPAWMPLLVLGIRLGAAAPLDAEDAAAGPPWSALDYGPFLSASVEAAPGNIARKGIVIRVDEGPGGVARGREFLLFDTDLLRWAAGWTGEGCIDWRGIAFDGSHGTHPAIRGALRFSNPVAPGWGRPEDGSFDDPRPRDRGGAGYGPLPREWARWKGLHLHGARAVFSYEVGGVEVRELPCAEALGERRALGRTIEVGPRKRDLVLQAAQARGARVDIDAALAVARLLPPAPADGGAAPAATAVFLRGGPAGAAFLDGGGGNLRLRWPAGEAPARLKLLYLECGESEGAAEIVEIARRASPPEPLAALVGGGPPRWPETLRTRAAPHGRGGGPFAAESLPPPMENPYRAWMRLGGFDFLDGGRRAAVCTWSGDVWTVDGLDDAEGHLAWRRIAGGLYQPLGLVAVDGVLHVLGRDQITRLHDLNGDGEADFYECFNHDAQATEHFHEFAMDLQRGPDGAFYYMKAARHALDAVVPQHGTLIRVSSDGRESRILASGFRAPNGLWVEGDGSFFTSDQEGHWIPANRIDRVREGGFHGYRWAFTRPDEVGQYEPPLCWIPPAFDRSPAAPLRVPAAAWGALGGRLLSISYGTGSLLLVLEDEVEGRVQGGAIKLPIEPFPTGILRGRFHPRDGRLYLAGLFGWAGDRTFPGGFYRVGYGGSPIGLPVLARAAKGGIWLRFDAPLEAKNAAEPRRFEIERWNYRRAESYGSKEYRVSDGEFGRDRLAASAVEHLRDGRTLFLAVPDLRPAMQMRLRYRLQSAAGARIAGELMLTVHALGDDETLRKELAP